MGRQRKPAKIDRDEAIQPLLTAKEWNAVASCLELPPQQARIIQMILCGKRDKQIALDMSLEPSTIRTHLRNIFARLGAADRVELILRVFKVHRQLSAGIEVRKID